MKIICIFVVVKHKKMSHKIEETLIKRTIGFDTRKKLNRSKRKISENIISEIEDKGLDIERLESLKLPYFVYQGQITLHGDFKDLSPNRLFGYKNILLNKNGSVGIKYNAIDYSKKSEIRKYASLSKWNVQINSTGFTMTYYTRTDTKEMILELVKSIPVKLIVGFISAFRISDYMGGGFIIEINLLSIRKENLDSFITWMVGSSDYVKMLNQKALKDKIEREAINARYQANKEKERAEAKEAISKVREADTNETYDNLPKEDFVGYYYAYSLGKVIKKVMKGVYRNGQLVIYTFDDSVGRYGVKEYEKLNNVMPPHNLKRGIRRIKNIEEQIQKVYKL